MKRSIALALTACLVVSAALAAPPKPDVAVKTWQFDVRHTGLKSLQFTAPGEKDAKTYWYLVYTITNRTGQDRVFAPKFELCTDTGAVLPEGKGVPSGVFTAIKGRENDPHIQDTASLTGRVLQGEDNARTGVLIFPDFDPKAGKVDVFLSGLSGDTAETPLPSPIKVKEVDEKGNVVEKESKTLTLRKTLQLTYQIGGEGAARTAVKPTKADEQWVMR